MSRTLLCVALMLIVVPTLLAQPTSVDRVAFEVFLSTSNEVPPVMGRDAGGTATISFLLTHETIPAEDCIDDDADGLDDDTGLPCECADSNGDGFDDNTGNSCVAGGFVDPDSIGDVVSAQVDFLVNYALGANETLTGMHIHRGVRGENGPVVVNSGLSSTPVAAGSGSFFRSVELTSMTDLAVVEEILANPAAFYFNVHSETSPPGLMRGQLREVPETPGGGGDGTGGGGDGLPDNVSGILRRIEATLNQIRVENAAQRDTTNRIAQRLGVVPTDPGAIDPEDLPDVEAPCPDDDTDGLDDDTGEPCPEDGA